MNLTYFQPRKRRNVENNNNIRFVAKTSDIRNFSQNIRSDIKTSEVAALVLAKENVSVIAGLFSRRKEAKEHEYYCETIAVLILIDKSLGQSPSRKY